LITVPSRSEKVADDSGMLSLSWWQFFNLLAPLTPVKESSVAVTASPFSYTSQANGHVLVTGGTVSSITLTRVSAHPTGLTTGLIPVGNKDVVTVTYTGLPTMTFIPS
jgi:hypothetical protein